MKKFNVGLQLYSIREDMERDMDAALKSVREIGYDYVEFAGYFGKSAGEVRALCDKHGLTCISVHQGFDAFSENRAEAIEYLKTIGARYCAIPYMAKDKHKGGGSFEKTTAEFIALGTAMKEAGIQLLYHNHDFEFSKFEGKYLLDWLYEAIPEDILKTELDICWVRYAGESPYNYIKKYSGRSPIVHLKDFTANKILSYRNTDYNESNPRPSYEETGFCYRPIGSGIQDIPSVLAAAEAAGADTVIVEQDRSADITPLEAAAASRAYLSYLGI